MDETATRRIIYGDYHMTAIDGPEDTLDSDEDFQELESLINPKPVPDADDPEEGSDELEELLAGAMEERKLDEYAKAARTKAKGGYGLSADDLERIRQWELRREWIAVSNTAIFKRYICACGYHSTIFEGLMLEQRHRSDSHANRWTAQDASVANLPNNTAVRVKKIPMCQRCASSKGFPISSEVIWEV
jgi:hypothetical protein